MQEAKVSVHLIGMTTDPLPLVYAAYQQCYKDGFVGQDWETYVKQSATPEGRKMQGDFIKAVLGSGHDSPIEHVSFNFAISGISRALSHQFVRHRIASYSQQSQRYVDMANVNAIIPPSIGNDPTLREIYEKFMDTTSSTYEALVVALVALGHDKKKAQEDARFVLPNAAETRIVATFNCRSLLNFFDLRCCNRAQWEIRRMADGMLSLVRDMLPEVFLAAGAKCERLGYCPEAQRFSCGKKKTIEQLLRAENEGLHKEDAVG